MKNNICFTIDTPECGFTDQMMRFSAFYKLGRALGYRYIHTPFKSFRSAQLPQNAKESLGQSKREPMDIYEFLGFNRYMQMVSGPNEVGCGRTLVDIAIGQQSFRNKNDASFNELLSYVSSSVLEHASGSRPILVRFSLNSNRKFFALIHEQVPILPDGLDLKSAFFQSAHISSPSLKTHSGRTNVLVHIRQGDTAVIKTPWETFIPVDPRRAGWMEEHKHPDSIGLENDFKNLDFGPIFSIKDYHDFIEGVSAELGDHGFSVKVFSDGFRRAFNSILSHAEVLKLSYQQVKVVKEAESGFDKVEFEPFQDWNNCKQYIGETDANLQALIHAVFEAEIMVLGYQQRMLPKFLANYRFDDMPLVIVLHKGAKPDYSDIAFGWDDQFIFVDIRDPDFRMIGAKITQSIDQT